MQYLLESAICLAILYAFYHAFLRRESFFQINRAYLLLAPVLAFAVPAMKIQLTQEEKAPVVLPAANVAAAEAPMIAWPTVVKRMQATPRLIGETLEKPVWALSLGTMLWWIYLVVGGLFGLRLLVQIYRLVRFIRLCKKEKQEGFVLAQTPANGPIASFFGFVFWSPGNLEDKDRQLIFEHEMVHVRQWHSLDLIFIELLIALQWFNPLLYVYRRSLREVHEYIADDCVVRRTRQRYQYAALLVRHHSAGNGAQPGLVNTFHSLIQKRLVMLAKLPSRPFRRAKYLLALPLFATLMLLFSFRLVDQLPQVQKATHYIEKTANTLAKTVVLREEPIQQHHDPKPYVLYWGPFESRLVYVASSNEYVAEMVLSPEAVWEALKREPRLWTGETLQQSISLEFNGILVRSDYKRPAVYEAIQPTLQQAAKDLKEGDQVLISNITLPDNLKGKIRISIGKSEFSEPPAPVKTPEVADIRWGKKTFLQGEKQYMTASEFWEMLESAAQVRFTSQYQKQPEAWNVALYNEKGAVIRARADRKDALTPDQLRARLAQEKAVIKPGCSIQFSAWELQAYDASTEAMDTIITFDPVTYEQTVQVVVKGGGLANLVPATDLFSVVIVDDIDPRRFLRVEDLRDYNFHWGNFDEDLPRSLLAQSYKSKAFGWIYGDGIITMWNSRFTKKELLEMFREQAQLFRGEESLNDFNFTISYNGYGQLVENGWVPDDLIKKLERELKSGEVVKITGLQARKNPVRYLVMLASTSKNHPELQKFMVEKAEVLTVYQDQQLIRLAIPVAEFNAMRDKLENNTDIWVQYGDIDLTRVTFELEVRDEDPKPELPVTKTRGGIFTVKLSVSPNPVKAQAAASVQVKVEKSGDGTLALYNLEGKQLFAQKVAIEKGENKLELPANALRAAGVYTVRLEMPYGMGSAKLVVE